jgi:hypothetical protein
MPPRRPPHWPFRLTDTISGWFGGANPAEWLTIGSVSFHADLYEIDGRRYLLDISPRRGYTRDIRRAHGRGTLSYDGTDTEVTFTEVTDRDVKHQVVIAYAAVKPRVILATGEHKNRPATSFLVDMGLARDDTPEGLLTAVPHVTVFEVSPAAQARPSAPAAEEEL